MRTDGRGPVEAFIDRIKTARTIMDDATSKIYAQNKIKGDKKDAIQAYITRVQATCILLNEAVPEITSIIEKLSSGDYPATLQKVTKFKNKLNGLLADCKSIGDGPLEDDFLSIHIIPINNLQTGLHHLEKYACAFILKNVKDKICKTN